MQESRKNAGVDDARKMALTKLSQEYTYLVDGVFAHKASQPSSQIAQTSHLFVSACNV